jgi:hypothetical protein
MDEMMDLLAREKEDREREGRQQEEKQRNR